MIIFVEQKTLEERYPTTATVRAINEGDFSARIVRSVDDDIDDKSILVVLRAALREARERSRRA